MEKNRAYDRCNGLHAVGARRVGGVDGYQEPEGTARHEVEARRGARRMPQRISSMIKVLMPREVRIPGVFVRTGFCLRFTGEKGICMAIGFASQA